MNYAEMSTEKLLQIRRALYADFQRNMTLSIAGMGRGRSRRNVAESKIKALDEVLNTRGYSYGKKV